MAARIQSGVILKEWLTLEECRRERVTDVPGAVGFVAFDYIVAAATVNAYPCRWPLFERVLINLLKTPAARRAAGQYRH